MNRKTNVALALAWALLVAIVCLVAYNHKSPEEIQAEKEAEELVSLNQEYKAMKADIADKITEAKARYEIAEAAVTEKQRELENLKKQYENEIAQLYWIMDEAHKLANEYREQDKNVDLNYLWTLGFQRAQ